MKNLFKQVEAVRPKRNVFDLTHDHKLTGQMGKLIPTLVMDCIPGDTIKLSGNALVRFAPILAPIMHRVDVTIHYFFVPWRLVWPGWEDFITNNNPTPLPYIPIVPQAGQGNESHRFCDYMGIPQDYANPDQTQTINVNAGAFAAYQKIYNEYYRDENLIPTPVPDELVSGANAYSDFAVQRYRAWEHDYYTACLPWAQKGATVEIPLGNIELDPNWNAGGSLPFFEDTAGGTHAGNIEQTTPGIGVGATYPQAYNPDGSLIVGPTSINDLRRAMKLQEWLEKNARGGTRYTEQIKFHFGVFSSDARLQRPEYITGVKSPVVISEVLSTAGTFDAEDPSTPTSPPTGNMAGHGAAVMEGKFGSFFCEEHGFIIGILSVMPKTAYFQGIPRHYMKFDSLEFFWPTFAHIGEQEVWQDEIYAFAEPVPGERTLFGYIPRYAEYKYLPSRVSGDFRDSLDYWHLGRKFANAPALNQNFIECVPTDVTRIFAVTDAGQDNLYMHVLHRIKRISPMPYFGSPSF